MKLRTHSGITLILSIFILIGCYEQREGCLDALASNFMVSADEDCMDCCQYPPLTFTIKHLFDTLNFDLGKVYSNRRGQTFIPKAISFYVSDVTLLQGEHWLPVDETILIEGVQSNMEQPDDVTIITRNGFEFEIGDFLNAGQYARLQFSVGLNNPEFTGGQTTIYETNDHPLDTVGNALWSDADTYRMYAIELIHDSVRLDTMTYVAVASPAIAIELPIEVVKLRGQKLSIPLVIDYKKWFENIDFEADSKEVISEKIMAGIKNSITILQ